MNEIEQLKKRIEQLEKTVKSGAQFEEVIRDVIFFDNNPTGALTSTSVVTSVDFGAQTVTTADLQTGVPAKFLKLYFRGQVYQIPVFSIS